MKEKIKTTKSYKAQAIKATLAITLFLITYLLILFLVIILTLVCIALGAEIFGMYPLVITIPLGLGLASLGIMILIFQLKFIFSKRKIYGSQLLEITQEEEPQLFKLIQETVSELGTYTPKKVFLSAETNASVFYEPNFLSLFIPSKKNLILGIGLVNMVTKKELKGILAHEFGHFSQKNMQLDSYVYKINNIIYSTLFEHESYEEMVENWSRHSPYFKVFVKISTYINNGIKLVFARLYNIINISYLGLSREREFRADQIAVNLVGLEAYKKTLLRFPLVEYAFNSVLEFYTKNHFRQITSTNFYKDLNSVINIIKEENNYPTTNELPDISLAEHKKYNKSKLVIKNQWDSHPTTEERISRLEKTGSSPDYQSDILANSLFKDITKTQEHFSKILLPISENSKEWEEISNEQFAQEYKNELLIYNFPKVYNGYYDIKRAKYFDLDKNELPCPETSKENLFGKEKIDLIYTEIALLSDIEILTNIANKSIPLNSFDYNGKRFKSKNAGNLIIELTTELEHINELIRLNDFQIYNYFRSIENKQNRPKLLKIMYSDFFEFEQSMESKLELSKRLYESLLFIKEFISYQNMKDNFKKIKPEEDLFKLELNKLLDVDFFHPDITEETREKIKHYASTDLDYLGVSTYLFENLSILVTAINNFGNLLSAKHFSLKKRLLIYQEELLKVEEKQTKP